jgi:hypothetical protein
VLYQLVCPSKAANEMMLSHLIGILRQARTKNKLSDIMGLLVFLDGMFLQILEGEEGAEKDLMLKKHSFLNWDMAYTSPSVKNWQCGQNLTTRGPSKG